MLRTDMYCPSRWTGRTFVDLLNSLDVSVVSYFAFRSVLVVFFRKLEF